MNMNHVEQFMTIVKYMNLSRASRELYISQPALSMSLSRLESELGVQLFYREGNKLVLATTEKSSTTISRICRTPMSVWWRKPAR